jgi:hypothetical protein
MSKMILHHPFGDLKHKLWPKERPGVKLTIWLPTTKIWESTWFTCVQVTCDMSLESSWQGLKLWFRLHLNRRSSHKVTRPQNRGSPNVDSSMGQKTIKMRASRRGAKYTIRGKVVASPKFGPWWVLWVQVAHGSS